MNEKNTLYIVVPCYKEQEVLPETSRRLREKMRQLMDEGKISRRSRVMFVNDGSSDNTWAIISELHEKEPEMFSGVNLSRNRGHQNALLAGLLTSAQQQSQKLVDDNEITRRAQAYAVETRERAEKDADSIYNQACAQVDKMLSGAAAALSRSASELAALRDSLLTQGSARQQDR